MLMTLTGTSTATFTVLLTTLDDSVWLAPFVAGSAASSSSSSTTTTTTSLSRHDKIVHGLAFLITLVGMAAICCLMAVAIQHGVLTWISTTLMSLSGDDGPTNSPSIILDEEHTDVAELWSEGIAMVLCWILAIGFCIKKKLKQRRRLVRPKGTSQGINESNNENTALLPPMSLTSIPPIDVDDVDQMSLPEVSISMSPHSTTYRDDTGAASTAASTSLKGDRTGIGTTTTRQPCTVVSLTVLGFLDEISYLPTLILGGVLTEWDLIVGTFVAGLLMLSIQVFVASQCKPLMDCLDKHVPLYGIIAIFATVLTFHWIWDMMEYG